MASDAKRRATEAARALTGMAVVERAFLFLDGPAEVLRAATACRRWHELATADSVWRVKARREGMVEKAGVFEVALPSVAGSSSSAAAEEEDEAAGVGLAFYAQVHALKVWPCEPFRARLALSSRHATFCCHPCGRVAR